jgi:hypothetical protein
MLLIALAVAWLVLVAFVLTMCRLAARSDAASIGRDGGPLHPRWERRAQPISTSAMAARRRPSRSGLPVE